MWMQFNGDIVTITNDISYSRIKFCINLIADKLCSYQFDRLGSVINDARVFKTYVLWRLDEVRDSAATSLFINII